MTVKKIRIAYNQGHCLGQDDNEIICEEVTLNIIPTEGWDLVKIYGKEKKTYPRKRSKWETVETGIHRGA